MNGRRRNEAVLTILPGRIGKGAEITCDGRCWSVETAGTSRRRNELVADDFDRGTIRLNASLRTGRRGWTLSGRKGTGNIPKRRLRLMRKASGIDRVDPLMRNGAD